MQRPLTIGYITVDDPRDRRTWSGINYFMLRALEEQGHKVITLGPLRPQPVLFFCKALNWLGLRLLGKRFNYRDSFVLSRAYARRLQKRMAGHSFDLLIAPAGLATTAHLRTSLPIVYMNDRSIAGALEYHAILKDLFAFSRKESLALERKALERTQLVIYASRWAAHAAITSAPSAASKVKVIPMGANLETAPAPPSARDFPRSPITLLMLGVQWESKGGPIAYDTLLELKRRGHSVKLVVCGCDPPPECNRPDLVREGFLNKNIPAHREKLEAHLRNADFLILPTRFEAYGIVFCEAAAYGLPVLATRTGGVPTAVEEGRTGVLLDLKAGDVAYADHIEELIKDPARWQAMRTRSRERYEQELNWAAFVRSLLNYASEAGLLRSAR